MKRLLLLLSPAILPIGWPQLDAVCEPSQRVLRIRHRTGDHPEEECGEDDIH